MRARALTLLTAGALALAACGGSTTSSASGGVTTAAAGGGSSTTAAAAGGGATTAPSGDTVKVRFVNVMAKTPAGVAIDIHLGARAPYTKLVSNLAYGAASDPVAVPVKGGGANLKVTDAGVALTDDARYNSMLIDGVKAGDQVVMVVGWNATGASGAGAVQFQRYTTSSSDGFLKPPAGKFNLQVNQTGGDDVDAILGVVGKACLGDDGLNSPLLTLDPGALQVHGVDVPTSTGSCQGKEILAPVSITGKPGSAWLVSVYGTADKPHLAAFDVTPG